MTEQLKPGSSFTFRNERWKIIEAYVIKWHDGSISKEYQIRSPYRSIKYLEIWIAKDGETEYSVWEEEPNTVLAETTSNSDGDSVLVGMRRVPRQITRQGITYTYQEHIMGGCEFAHEYESVMSIDYTDSNGYKLLSLEVWSGELEISVGEKIEKTDIKDIQDGKLDLADRPFAKFIGKSMGFFIVVGIFLLSVITGQCSNDEHNDGTHHIYHHRRPWGGGGK